MTSSLASPRLLAALALAGAAACQPGTSPHPVARSAGFTVSGRVTGTASAGATVRLSSGFDGIRFAVADGDGRFEFGGLQRGQYDLLPVAGAGVAFAPSTRRVTVVGGDVAGQDFTASASNAIRGRVQGAGAGDILVTVDGPISATRATDAEGDYLVAGLPDGTYLVRATAAPGAPLRYVSPSGALVAVGGGQAITQDFASGPATELHAISGTVSGPAPGGVELRLFGSVTGATRSDAGGHYAFAGLPGGSYAVLAVPPDGTLFRQRDRFVSLAGADVAGVDFEGYAPSPPRFAYLAAWNDGTDLQDVLYQFAVGADGALSLLAPAAVALPGRALSLATSPSGGQVYAAMVGATSLAQFAVGQDGQLSPLDPATVPADANPSLLAVDPGGAWLWAYSPATLRISLYAIGAGGALEPRPQLAEVGEGVTGMVVHPSGRFLYLASSSGLRQFAVGAEGALTPLVPALVPAATDLLLTASTHLTFTAIQYDAIALDPTGRYAYATQLQFSELKSAVAAFLVLPDGTLTSLGWGARAELSDLWLRDGPTSLVVEPGGRGAYAGYAGHFLFPATGPSQYRLERNGIVNDVNPVAPADGGPNQAALVPSPTGRHLYVVNNTATAAGVTWLSVGEDGLLTQQGSVQAGYSAAALVLAGP